MSNTLPFLKKWFTGWWFRDWVRRSLAWKAHVQSLFDFGEPVSVAARVHLTANVVKDLLGSERTDVSFRCDRHEVFVQFRIKDTRHKPLLTHEVNGIAQIVVTALDGTLTVSRPLNNDFVLRFDSEWTRVEQANITFEKRECRKFFFALALYSVVIALLLAKTSEWATGFIIYLTRLIEPTADHSLPAPCPPELADCWEIDDES